MTIPELITLVLESIRNQFYTGGRNCEFSDFLRDKRALTKAISRYGYECHQRGWEFDSKHILGEIMKLLQEIKRSGADIRYLPTYLDGAVKRHIGQRAEELSAKAKSIPRNVAKIVAGTRKVEAVREPSATEILATVYKDLRRFKAPNPNPKKSQLDLL
ncbi:MAG: hypothetical protein ACTHMT_05760 [Verrucomicrobiota bacterium]